MSDITMDGFAGDGVARAHAPARAVVYNEAIVKKFVIAAVFWGVVAFLVGVVLALQLA